MKFTLKWLFVAVAFVAFACVALYNANHAWADAARLFTVLVLLLAIVGAVYSEQRAFCVGVCVLGWGFLFLNHFASPVTNISGLLDMAYRSIERTVPYTGSVPHGAETLGATVFNSPPKAYKMPVEMHFHSLGQSLFTLMFAVIGGAGARWFARAREGPVKEKSGPATGN